MIQELFSGLPAAIAAGAGIGIVFAILESIFGREKKDEISIEENGTEELEDYLDGFGG